MREKFPQQQQQQQPYFLPAHASCWVGVALPLCWIQNVVPSPPPSFIFFLLQMELGQEDGRRFFSLSSADRRVSSASSAPSDPVDIPGAAARRGSGNGDSGAAGGEPNTTTSLQEVCLCTYHRYRVYI